MKLRLVFAWEECLVQLPEGFTAPAQQLYDGFFDWLKTRSAQWADTPCGGICPSYGSGDFMAYLNECALPEGGAKLLENSESADICLRF